MDEANTVASEHPDTTELVRAREAFARHEWEQAYQALRTLDDREALHAGDVERLADSTRWTGRYGELLVLLERAHTAYAAQRDSRSSARIALALTRYFYENNNSAAASGWAKRAAHELEGVPECREHGMLQWMFSRACFESGDLDDALVAARAVAETGRRLGEPDLETLGTHAEGHVLIARGDVRDGLALVDQAMAVAMSGSVELMTAGTMYCSTIWACRNVGDWRRASEWTDLSLRWCEREAVAGFPGLCRFHRAEVMRVRGALDAAEREAAAAAQELAVAAPRHAGWAFGELGEIRRRRGDAAGAGDAFRRAVVFGYDPQPGLALLQLDNGDPHGALRSMQRALAEPSGFHEEQRASLLPAGVRIALDADDIDAARMMSAQLQEAAKRCGTAMYVAAAREVDGRIQLAEGRPAAATTTLREAVRMLCEFEAPYEAAHARVALAEAYTALGDRYAAALELDAARSTFERLGAATDLARLSGSAPGHAVRTFLFTDIVDSTRLVEVLGDDAWAGVLAWHDRTCRAILAGYGGEEVDHTGDGFFLAFSDVGSALDFAVSLQRTLQEHRRNHGFAPQVRIGVHAGEALSRGANFGGREVHLAARVAAASGAGEILVTAASLDQLAPGRAASEPRVLTLKGVSTPVEVATLEWR